MSVFLYFGSQIQRCGSQELHHKLEGWTSVQCTCSQIQVKSNLHCSRILNVMAPITGRFSGPLGALGNHVFFLKFVLNLKKEKLIILYFEFCNIFILACVTPIFVAVWFFTNENMFFTRWHIFLEWLAWHVFSQLWEVVSGTLKMLLLYEMLLWVAVVSVAPFGFFLGTIPNLTVTSHLQTGFVWLQQHLWQWSNHLLRACFHCCTWVYGCWQSSRSRRYVFVCLNFGGGWLRGRGWRWGEVRWVGGQGGWLRE